MWGSSLRKMAGSLFLAAMVLAARDGELDPNTPLSSDDAALIGILGHHVKTVFADYGGRVGMDD